MPDNAIVVKVRREAEEQPVCFVAMPFSSGKFKSLYRLIAQAANNLNLRPVRTDYAQMTDTFVRDIVLYTRKARVVVAVCTPEEATRAPNPNVMYELGYAQAIGKPSVIMSTARLPSDIQSQYALLYSEEHVGEPGAEASEREKQLLAQFEEALINSIEKAVAAALKRSPNTLTDSVYDDINVALAKCGVLVEPDFLDNFKTIFDYANNIHTHFQTIEATRTEHLRLLAEAAVNALEVGAGEVSAFNRHWGEYEATCQPIFRDIYPNIEKEQAAVAAAFAKLSERADPASRKQVEKCEGFYGMVADYLGEYRAAHESLSSRYNGDFQKLREPSRVGRIAREVRDLSEKARDIRMQAGTLMVTLVNLIAR